MSLTAAQPKTASLSTTEAYDIGLESYVYFYSLLSMEITRRQCINLDSGIKPGSGPSNYFSHVRAYPGADFRAVVRPNFDTLYSITWFDLASEPIVLSIPDSKGRYYLMPILDMFSDVFASPGWRTSGTGEQHLAICGPGWSGKLPSGVERIDSPTKHAWLVGRTKTDGPDDYASVHQFQDGLKLTALSQFGSSVTSSIPKVTSDSSVDMKTPPLEQVNQMSADKYFSLAAELLKEHAPHVTDWSILSRMKKIGIIPGQSFDMNALSPENQKAVAKGASDALKLMVEKLQTLGRRVNGWNMNTDTMGVYGNYYLKRAIVAMVGLGANQPEDAVYPLNVLDADGEPLNGATNYVLHFNKEELPPVDAFWSLTMYDKDGFQAANVLNRFAVSSWMPFSYNADGSLDLYMQNKNPGPDKEANWLPAPLCQLGVTLRLYAPKNEVLTGVWNPPAIKKAK